MASSHIFSPFYLVCINTRVIYLEISVNVVLLEFIINICDVWRNWYHLYNLKNVKNIHRGVLLLVKLNSKITVNSRQRVVKFIRLVEEIPFLPGFFVSWILFQVH